MEPRVRRPVPVFINASGGPTSEFVNTGTVQMKSFFLLMMLPYLQLRVGMLTTLVRAPNSNEVFVYRGYSAISLLFSYVDV